MLLFTSLSFLFLIKESVANHLALSQRASCTVLAEGYEVIDDAPAINTAIKTCGDAGTIVLPASEIYSIRSPIDFSPCRDCDVQLEGQLLLSTDREFWTNKTAFISMTGVKGARFRSLTGKGLIDGNSKAFYQRDRPNLTYDNQPVVLPIIQSSNILVDGITVRNAPKQFFRVDGRSSNVRFKNLKVIVEGQWWHDIWTRGESIAFQFRNSSNIILDSINVKMASDRRPDNKVGVCVGIDYSTSDIDIKNVVCENTSDGIHMQFGSVGFYQTPPAADQWSRNIRISNVTLNADSNTGIKNLMGFSHANISNVTYDGVLVTEGTPAVSNVCYTIKWERTDACSTAPGGGLEKMQANFQNIWFKNYKVKTGKPQLACVYNSTCDFHFEGWTTIGS